MLRLLAVPALMTLSVATANPLASFRRSPFWEEQVLEEHTDDGIRILWNAPAVMRDDLPTRLVVYATPNGNTAEQTLGCAKAEGLDWHYDIQHIAAQTRLWRSRDKARNIVLAVVQPDNLSWPAWKASRRDGPSRIAELVESMRARLGDATSVTLTGHSGGGSFLFGFLDAADSLPDWVDRIAFLDANYSYSDERRHGDKFLAWLASVPEARLIVLAYDDRNVTLNGRKVVSEAGGTWRACDRMLESLRKRIPFVTRVRGSLEYHLALNGRVSIVRDRNPDNRILHTVLVETNGFVWAMTQGTKAEARVGRYRGARSYPAWIQPAKPLKPGAGCDLAAVPPRPADAPGGHAVMAGVAALPLTERENQLVAEILSGNVPTFVRRLRVIETTSVETNGARHRALVTVMPDYLAVGSDTDFVRVPLTPMAAKRVADAWGLAFTTRRLSDAVHAVSEVRLEPRPLSVDRESVATFVQHSDIIEGQRAGKEAGLVVSGIKKDVVLTNKLTEKPDRVAIYGWHQLNGIPIQPLTTVHVNTYVDYSHGIRFVARTVNVDGRTRDYLDVLRDESLCPLLSDEGPIAATY